jgi:tryptophanyl-tRNA synthetase
MSKSKNNAIFFHDDEKTIKKKINNALSGGQKTIEEHRKLGGNPEQDMSLQYLKAFFLSEEESKEIEMKYKKGEILSGEMKKMFQNKLLDFIKNFQHNEKNISDKEVDNCVLKNSE